MRIVYLHQYFNTRAMSGGTRSFEMARRLVARGHEVHVVTSWREPSARRGWYTEEVEGIHVHWLPVTYSNYMGFLARMRAFLSFAIRSSHYAASIADADVVFATSTPLTIALPGVYAAWRLRVPFVFEVRDLWPEVPIALGVLRNPVLKWAARRLERFAYNHSSRIVALAPGMAQSIVESGIDPRRVSIVPNGCDLDLFSAAANMLPTERMLLYIGTVGPANGADYLPRLAAAIRARHPDAGIRIVVIGDGKELNNVKAQADRLGLTKAEIEFLGALPKKEIPAYLARCRATIMTYTGPNVLYRDSVSNKFFDSLAAGRMVMANFAGFSTLVAKAAGAGELLPLDDLDDAADRVTRLVLHDESLARGGRQALALARDLFDRDRLAQMLETVLLQACNRAELKEEPPVGEEFRELWMKMKAEDAG